MSTKKANYPKFVYSKSGQLYEVAGESSDSEPEVQKKTARKDHKKPVKYVSKLSIDSDSEEEVAPRPSKKPTKKKKSEPKKEKSSQETTSAHSKKHSSKSHKKEPSKKRKREESESESDTDPDEEDHIRLKRAKAELLSNEQMKEKTQKELEKKYKQAKTYVKWYEKEYLKESEDKRPLWEQASRKMTAAAATYVKYIGLQKAKISPTSHLIKAIPKLRENGEKKFKEALEIVAGLSKEDADKFWKEQERNKNAKTFEELVTKKEYSQRTMQAMSQNAPPKPAEKPAENVDEEEDDQ